MTIYLDRVMRGVHYRLRQFSTFPRDEYLVSKPQERGSTYLFYSLRYSLERRHLTNADFSMDPGVLDLWDRNGAIHLSIGAVVLEIYCNGYCV